MALIKVQSVAIPKHAFQIEASEEGDQLGMQTKGDQHLACLVQVSYSMGLLALQTKW